MYMRSTRVETFGDVVVQTRGVVGHRAVLYAQNKIMAVTRKGGEPILYARVKLSRSADPAVSRPALAQANLDVNGRQLRAQVAARTMYEAVDLLQARLRERHSQLARYRAANRHGTPSAAVAEWRREDKSADRPEFVPRPPNDREIIRHKSFALARESAVDAVAEMEAMGYDFHLFVDAETGQDSVVEQVEPTGYRLTRAGVATPSTPATTPLPDAFTISRHPAPRLNESEAADRLELTGSPFVFFVDTETGHGNVLYRRYDGNYGLITPPA
jgi:hypothetical protein